MTFSNWLVFCGVAGLLSFTPGPAVLLAISNSVAVGARRAMIGSMGNAAGLFIVSAIATAGMGVVLATSAAAFLALKVAGAAYLVYLGVKQWRSQDSAFAEMPSVVRPAPLRSAWRLFRSGLTVALTNPKSILFFSALYPHFLTREAPMLTQFMVLTATFAACAVMAHAFYVLLARALKNQFGQPSRVRLFNRVSGGAFIVLGLGLLGLRSKAG